MGIPSFPKKIGCGTIHKAKEGTLHKTEVGHEILAVKEEYKYLGVILDNKLTYKSHCKYVVNKCLNRMNLLRLLSGTNWGGTKSCLLTIYRTMGWLEHEGNRYW